VDRRIQLEERVREAALELAFLQKENLRRRYLLDPVAWVEERMGAKPWSKQKQILRAMATNRRVAVPSCHEVGKSWIAAAIVCWWIDAHPPGSAFVVTSAPSANQVRAILWREIGRAHMKANLPGRLNQTEWKMPVTVNLSNAIETAPGEKSQGFREELVAFGRKPDDYDPTAFQGIHAPYVLIIFDEATGIPASLWEAGDSLIANDDSKALAIGNPDDPNCEFARLCSPGSVWHTIPISAFDSPNFTGEEMPRDVKSQLIGKRYVEEKRKRWAIGWAWKDAAGRETTYEKGVLVGPPPGVEFNEAVKDTNPLWQSKILGMFPHVASFGGLIPMAWVRAAQDRYEDKKIANTAEKWLGVDVGGGGDSSVVALRHGRRVKVIREDNNPDTMSTCGNVVADLQTTGAERANIDEIGIGKGVADRGKEMGLNFVPINVGVKAVDEEHFANRRSELWWLVRREFETNNIEIDPQDDDLAAELCSIMFKRLSNGKIQIESKADAKRRGVASPNRADALMLSYAEPIEEEVEDLGTVRPLW
jgi:hypothetical protein